MQVLAGVATVVAAVSAGVLGGVYLAFSVMVLPALRAGGPVEAVATMRSINRLAVRPPFMTVFFGSALSAVVAVVADAVAGAQPLVIVGGVLALASFVVTVARNVPLNDGLAGDAPDWPRFEPRWRVANHVRAALAVAAAACFGTGLATPW